MIQVISRALDILEFLSTGPGQEFTLAQIAEQTSIQKTTCSNIIKSLESRGYVEHRCRMAGYSLGYRAYQLVFCPLFYEKLKAVAAPVLKSVFHQTEETVILAVLENEKRIVIAKEECTQGITARINHATNLYRSASGRIIAAFTSEKDLETIISRAGLPDVADWPEVTSKRKLEEELARIRREGVAVARSQFDLVGIAVPIFKGNTVIASIGVCLPGFRLGEGTQHAIIHTLMKAAETIEKSLKGGLMTIQV